MNYGTLFSGVFYIHTVSTLLVGTPTFPPGLHGREENQTLEYNTKKQTRTEKTKTNQGNTYTYIHKRKDNTHERPSNDVSVQARVSVDAVAVGDDPGVAHGHVDGRVPYPGRLHQPPEGFVEENRVALFVQAVVPSSDRVACGIFYAKKLVIFQYSSSPAVEADCPVVIGQFAEMPDGDWSVSFRVA